MNNDQLLHILQELQLMIFRTRRYGAEGNDIIINDLEANYQYYRNMLDGYGGKYG